MGTAPPWASFWTPGRARPERLRSELYREGQSGISVHPDLLYNCPKGEETVLGFGCSSLPLTIAISGVCPEARRRRPGPGWDWGCGLGQIQSKRPQSSAKLRGLQHRGLFEKPVPSGCTLEAPEPLRGFKAPGEELTDHPGSQSCSLRLLHSALPRQNLFSLWSHGAGVKYATETWSWNRPSNSSFIPSFALTNAFDHQVWNTLFLFTQSCPTLCDPVDCSTPGFHVLHHLPGLAQIHVHWVADAVWHLILCLPPPFAFSLSQHQGLFLFCGNSCLAFRWVVGWSVLLIPCFNESTRSPASGQA